MIKAKPKKNVMIRRGVSHGLNMVTINGHESDSGVANDIDGDYGDHEHEHKMRANTKTKSKKAHKPFRVDRDTDDEENDSQLPMNRRHEKILSMTSTVASMTDSFKDPFRNQQPRKYIRKSFLSSTSDGDVIYESGDDEPKMNVMSKSTPYQLMSARQPPPSGGNSPHPLAHGMYMYLRLLSNLVTFLCKSVP